MYIYIYIQTYIYTHICNHIYICKCKQIDMYIVTAQLGTHAWLKSEGTENSPVPVLAPHTSSAVICLYEDRWTDG